MANAGDTRPYHCSKCRTHGRIMGAVLGFFVGSYVTGESGAPMWLMLVIGAATGALGCWAWNPEA